MGRIGRRIALRVAAGVALTGVLAMASANHYILPCEEVCTSVRSSATDIGIGSPGAVTSDPYGNIYFSSPSLVYRLDARGGLTRIAGSSTSGFAGDGGRGTDALLNFPAMYPELEKWPSEFPEFVGAVAADAAGNVYIADVYNGRVRKVDAAGTITTYVDQAGWAMGVALASDGRLVISEQYGTVYRVDSDGSWDVLARNNCGHHLTAGVCAPSQLAIDRSGNVYVADTYCRVRRIGPDNSVVTFAGDDTHWSRYDTWTCGYSGDGGPATSAALQSLPYAVAVDPDDNVFIADTHNHCIRRVDRAGIINTFAGRCEQRGFSGDGGAAISALLARPRGVAVDPAGNVYIADTDNNRIRKVGADGTITTIAGNGDAVPNVLPAPQDAAKHWVPGHRSSGDGGPAPAASGRRGGP